jgi:hypothetical protein
MGHRSLLENAVGLGGSVLILAALVGILARRRYRICYTFLLYLGAVLLSDLLIIFWPDRFYVRSFWLLKEILNNALRFGVALELSFRTFRAFPGARSTARGIALLLLAVTLVTVVAVSGDGSPGTSSAPPSFEQIAGRIQPRLLNGTIWLFTAIAATILWYRLPVDSFHKAILIGFVPYLLIFTTGLNVLDSYSWDQGLRIYINFAQVGAYYVLMTYWVWTAWREATGPVQALDGVGILQRQPG